MNTPDFRESEEQSGDPVLDSLLQEAQKALGTEGLDRLLQASQRFSGNVTVHAEEGVAYVEDQHFKLKQTLLQIPHFVKAALGAGLTPKQTEDTLLAFFEEDPFEFDSPADTLLVATTAFEKLQENHNSFNRPAYQRFRKCMAVCNKYGVLDSGLYALSIAAQLGLPLKEALNLIQYLPDQDGHLSGYNFSVFNEALASLLHAQTDPEVIIHAFQNLAGDRPYYRQSKYTYFQEAVTFGCPSVGISPQKLLSAYKKYGNGQDITEFISEYMEQRQRDLTPQAGLEVASHTSRDKYFTQPKDRLSSPHCLMRQNDLLMKDRWICCGLPIADIIYLNG